jgi:hypothetical protein
LSGRKFFRDYHRVVRSCWFGGNFVALQWHYRFALARGLQNQLRPPGVSADGVREVGK